MGRVIISQNDLPFPEDRDLGNKVQKLRYRVVNNNRNQVSDWSVINYVEQQTLKSESRDGMPTGGLTGEVPAKLSDTDYDVGWEPVTSLIPTGTYVEPGDTEYGLSPTGGLEDQVLTKNSGADHDTYWETPHYVLSGGSAGQVLGKVSNTSYDYNWIDASIDPQDGNLIIAISTLS